MIEQQQFDYPVDGSGSALPDPNEWARHDAAQQKINREGIFAARQAIRLARGQAQIIDVQEVPQPPTPPEITSGPQGN